MVKKWDKAISNIFDDSKVSEEVKLNRSIYLEQKVGDLKQRIV